MFKRKKQNTTKRLTTQNNSAAPVFSYYANRTTEPRERQSPRSQKTTQVSAARTPWLTLLPSFIALGGILISIFYATSLSLSPKIQIDGTNKQQLLRSTGFYQQEAGRLMSSSLFNRSKLTIDTAKLASQLQEKYPELGHVSVIIPLLGRRPIIEVQPATAQLQLTTLSGSFIIDQQGRALIASKDVTSSLRDSLPNVIDESGLSVEVGKSVLPVANTTFMADLGFQLKAKQLHIQNLTLPALANELRLKLTDKPYFVKFDMQSDVRQQVGAFIATKEKLEAEGITPAEYIDVRLADKVFYR